MRKIVLICAPLMLTGCATMFGDSQDKISINSATPETKLYVNGDYIGNGTVQYSVPRGKTVSISAKKEGCVQKFMQSDRSVNGLTWLNLLFWPGFIVDAATGAIQKTDPTFYTVTPDCGNS